MRRIIEFPFFFIPWGPKTQKSSPFFKFQERLKLFLVAEKEKFSNLINWKAPPGQSLKLLITPKMSNYSIAIAQLTQVSLKNLSCQIVNNSLLFVNNTVNRLLKSWSPKTWLRNTVFCTFVFTRWEIKGSLIKQVQKKNLFKELHPQNR